MGKTKFKRRKRPRTDSPEPTTENEEEIPASKKQRRDREEQRLHQGEDEPTENQNQSEELEQHVEGDANQSEPEVNAQSSAVTILIANEFMSPASQEVIENCIRTFIDASSNAALQMTACIACARESKLEEVTETKICDIPHKQRLFPHTPHPKHDLIDGMLVYPPAICKDDASKASICRECKTSLKADKIPKFALANDMWVGEIPRQLQVLTLPERMLIAKYFPAAYIIKLFPKKKGAAYWDHRQMHRGLRGNVSTYRLDPSQVAAMVTGSIMPHAPSILPATIGVTFIGPKGLTERTMPSMFRVRRERVKDALVWLKENNTLYSNIEISDDRLNDLPENGIPTELLATVKHSTDVEAVYREHDGYVPSQEGEEEQTAAGEHIEDEEEEESIRQERVEPEVMPLDSMGVVDMDGADITNHELMAHALANAAARPMPEDFTIRRGSAFINEWPRKDAITGQRNDGGPSNPNHLLGSFPTLFPYARGGFEMDRPVDVPYETHVRWAMRYADRRFRKDPQFPFQVFGVTQKRQVCRSAVVQINKASFARHRNLLATIKPEDLLKASQEEARKVPFSNPAIRALRSEMSATRTRVTGTDEERQSVRSKIWGMNLIHNPPSLWLTINPADTQDPIAQVLAGVDIDLDAFSKTAGPDSAQRAINIAGDPFAAAQFFHFMVKTVLEVLIGVKKKGDGRVQRQEGIMGTVQSYIGTVEAQGRGTLHLHMLLWLKDAPSSQLMREALKSEEFRDKVRTYIKSVISADIRGLNTEEVKRMPMEKEASYSRPIDPITHPRESKEQEERLARAVQLHQCSAMSCLRMVKGCFICKRRAPFRLSEEAWIHEDGQWGPKRYCAFLNNWNPPIMTCLRANHDLKLMMNGAETLAVTWYITDYATKKQQRSSNVSALLAKRLAFHKEQERHTKDMQDINRRLIQRCTNTLTRDREFSAPEIMSYLMGWGDRFESHHFVMIFWEPVLVNLKKAYPGLNQGSRYGESSLAHSQESREIISFKDDAVELRDQLRDYQFRGEGLAHLNFLDFQLDTYEAKKEEPEEDSVDEDGQTAPRRGRPLNQRFDYMEEAGKATRCRVKRTQGHETLPRFVGRWFPRNDKPNEQELYSACMITLLMPWRDLQDLKRPEETFSQSFERFKTICSARCQRVMDNIQYYHECSDSAAEKRKAEAAGETAYSFLDLELGEEELETLRQETYGDLDDITEEDIEAARLSRMKDRERNHANVAIDIATEAGLFGDKEQQAEYEPIARRADTDETDKFTAWQKILKSITRKQNEREGHVNIHTLENPEIRVQQAAVEEAADSNPSITVAPQTDADATQNQIRRPKLQLLNEEQRRAHDIVEEKLKKHLADEPTEQLKMMILGPGGTGKSMLIGAITETFEFYDASSKLAKCATTGIAATDIGALTLHSWAVLNRNMKNEDWLERSPKDSQKRRRENIQGHPFIIIDEVSMADKVAFCSTSEATAVARAEDGTGSLQQPFGGAHIITTGDFHQFPPVGNPTGALYCENENDTARAKIGREIFLQFDTVVILTQQIRVKDPLWTNILQKIRVGECRDDDLDEIRKLILTNPDCPTTDYGAVPWDKAILVTPRNAVREMWNFEALKRHCKKTGNRRYVAPAEDTLRETDDVLPQEARLSVAQIEDKDKGKLSDVVNIAIGMKAMVLLNLATEADIANGTRGTIVDIILDQREQSPIEDGEGTIHLKYPPAAIIFKPDGASKLKFEGLDEGLVPISPHTTTFTATSRNGETYKIRRRQLAITAGYAFTDYKSQGQTIEYVIIDIAKPPSGSISPFNVYVALSRSRGRDTIRLLRDFDEALFTNHPSESLRKDMIRIEKINEMTKEAFERSRRVDRPAVQ